MSYEYFWTKVVTDVASIGFNNISLDNHDVDSENVI